MPAYQSFYNGYGRNGAPRGYGQQRGASPYLDAPQQDPTGPAVDRTATDPPYESPEARERRLALTALRRNRPGMGGPMAAPTAAAAPPSFVDRSNPPLASDAPRTYTPTYGGYDSGFQESPDTPYTPPDADSTPYTPPPAPPPTPAAPASYAVRPPAGLISADAYQQALQGGTLPDAYRAAYRYFLGREPSEGEIDGWVRQGTDPRTRDRILWEIMNSDEARARNGMTPGDVHEAEQAGHEVTVGAPTTPAAGSGGFGAGPRVTGSMSGVHGVDPNNWGSMDSTKYRALEFLKGMSEETGQPVTINNVAAWVNDPRFQEMFPGVTFDGKDRLQFQGFVDPHSGTALGDIDILLSADRNAPDAPLEMWWGPVDTAASGGSARATSPTLPTTTIAPPSTATPTAAQLQAALAGGGQNLPSVSIQALLEELGLVPRRATGTAVGFDLP